MLNANQVLLKLIERYDYGGAYTLLVNLGLEQTDLSHIIKSCRYAINFDFESARQALQLVSDHTKVNQEYKALLDRKSVV